MSLPTPPAEAIEDDSEPFEEKMKRFTSTLWEQMAEAKMFDQTIEANMKTLGFGCIEMSKK